METAGSLTMRLWHSCGNMLKARTTAQTKLGTSLSQFACHNLHAACARAALAFALPRCFTSLSGVVSVATALPAHHLTEIDLERLCTCTYPENLSRLLLISRGYVILEVILE